MNQNTSPPNQTDAAPVVSETAPFRLTPGILREGTWQARIDPVTADKTAPVISMTHQGRPLDGVSLARDGAGWALTVTLPVTVLSSGVQTILVTETTSQAVLHALHISAGDVLDDNILAEVTLLRAELDMLKRAFRRHCTETG